MDADCDLLYSNQPHLYITEDNTLELCDGSSECKDEGD